MKSSFSIFAAIILSGCASVVPEDVACNTYMDNIVPRSGFDAIEDACLARGYRGSMYPRVKASYQGVVE